MQLLRFLGSILCKGHGLVLFLILLLVGISIRHLEKDGKETLIAGALSSIYYPAQLVVSSVNRIHSVTYENDSLKRENARLKLERDNLREGLEEANRLRELVHFDNVWEYPIVTARVIGQNPGRFLTTFVVNRGTDHGIEVDLPVFTTQGLVGRISAVSRSHSKVQLLPDPSLHVSILVQRTRVVGFLNGGSANTLQAFVPSYTGVREGDTLVTSGLGGIYPKGIGVGIVRSLEKGDLDVVTNIEVAPFQKFTRLEEVFIMQKRPDWIVQEMLKNAEVH
ncbi:MAG: rod shape-determining protein MreC [Hallerella porci]|uniref:Cell shape-determining protein MreC n=1 Tax=Hallerella porci TaxID=1945871 RepID=A0ABX5LKA0_9BACT|nr:MULTISPECIES: rod shape-determining protein MreC [Hallerella]MCI5600968.1 rod shape-determining protein MreC [Hallerella sp.]MDY3920683.1 rod shape-determining protein MreC [Hallerella porci]PWK99193.1 rod shape-determining protein MreC [Hallerella porci]